jgi:uncharacterized protein
LRYVLFYESSDDVASKAPLYMNRHGGHIDEFHAAGKLLQIGTFGDPQTEGAMCVFTTREAAEEFATNDPFVVNGVVRRWYIREWREILAGD